MKNKIKYLFLLTIAQSCTHYPEHKLKITNKSTEDVFVDYRFDEKKLSISDTLNQQGDTLRVNDSVRPVLREPWESIIGRNSKDSILGILVVKSQILKKKKWKEIVENGDYEIKTYTVKQLRDLKWDVVLYDGK